MKKSIKVLEVWTNSDGVVYFKGVNAELNRAQLDVVREQAMSLWARMIQGY